MHLTTKYTYVYRLIGIIGCLLVLASLIMPWVTISVGSLQGYPEGGSPTGWQLANLDKGGAWDENIMGYLFMIVYSFVILPPIGIIFLAIGKDARGMGYYLIIMSIFFLLLLLLMLPVIQESVPTPPDPYGELTQEELDLLTPEQNKSLQEQMVHRNKILNMKRIQFVPSIGVILAVAGSIVTYVGARLVMKDTERLADIYNYYVLLVEAHKGNRITKEEEDLLAAQRKLYKVTRQEHEMLLHRMFPQQRDFENALYMHDHPVDMDRMIIEKSLQDYEVFVAQAMGHGAPTKEELQMLEVIRRTLNISMDDHYMVVEYLKADGRIKEAAPPKPTNKLTNVPKEIQTTQEETPRYVQSWQYKSTITRETPLDSETKEEPLSKTSFVPPPLKADRGAKPSLGDVMGAEQKPEKQLPSKIEAPPAKPAVPPAPKVAPGPIVIPRLGQSAPVPKEEPKVPEPLDEEDEHEEAPAAPKVVAAPAAPATVPAKPKPKRPTKVKCNKCGTTIPVPPSDVPVSIKCPGCGVTGKI